MPSNYRKLAVDFNDNGKIDLLREPEDAIGSVANFLKFHGWHTGEPIAFRVKLSDGNLVGDTSTPRPVAKWQEAGVLINEQVDTSLPAWLLDFTAEGGKEYWMVFNNFAVITNYNNSNFYAMSVYQLAQAVIEARVNHAN
jgi:membrane-bound lytic murein transglycosylase B